MLIDADLRTEINRDRHRCPDDRYYEYIERLLIICEAHAKVIDDLNDRILKLEERLMFT